MTQDQSREAILAQWHRLPAWKRRNSQDAAEFAHIMITSRPDITNFDCSVNPFLVVRSWLVAEQQTTVQGSKRRGKQSSPAGQIEISR